MLVFFIRILVFSLVFNNTHKEFNSRQSDLKGSLNSFQKMPLRIQAERKDAENEESQFQFEPSIVADCRVEVGASTSFGIKVAYETNRQVPTFVSPLVADLNNDGKIEIISIGMRDFFHEGSRFQGERSGNLLIFEGETGKLLNEITTPMMAFQGPTPIVVGDINNDGNAEIIISTIDHNSNPIQDRGILICYDHRGTILWKSSEKVGQNAPLHYGGVPSLADFNQDGVPEVYIYNEIFNAQNGQKLVDGGDFGIGLMNSYPLGAVSTTIAADFLPKDGLELAAGNTIYEVEINNSGGKNGNAMRPINADFMLNGFPAQDGYTAVADINLDGELDIIVTTGKKQSPSIERTIYAWDPRKQELISSATIFQEGGDALHTSLAFIGDVTGNGKPEIGVASPFRLDFFSYNGTKEFERVWNLSSSDASGQTRLTMFDFNGDGKQEILFKDETSLRIIDATENFPKLITSYPSYSDTGAEGPVVADINNDGQAQILFTSNQSGQKGPPYGKIEVLTSSYSPWIPARRVWNQYTYFNRNINNDLSIPQNQKTLSQLNIESELSQNCENTSIKPQPNNFLVQSTIFNDEGCITFPAIDASIELFYENNNCLEEEEFKIQFSLRNNSEVNKIREGIEISFFKGNPVENGHFIKTITYQKEILPGTITEKNQVVIPWNEEINEIFAVVNSNDTIEGNELQYNKTFPECDYSNNSSNLSLRLNYTPAPIAAGDQEFCNSATFSNIYILGENIKWYEDPNTSIPYSQQDEIQNNGTYYATQTKNGCESFERTPVYIVINQVDQPEGPDEFSFCVAANPTLDQLDLEADQLIWYTSATGGEPLDKFTPLSDNTTYFATNVNRFSGCESIPRKPVFVRTNNCDIEIFTAVSIDNNNKNDFFRITNIELFPDNYLEIYNRYGKIVYQTSKYGQNGNIFTGEANVDGVLNKENGLPTGNYLYILKYKSMRDSNYKIAKGTLFLINNK